MFIDAPTDNLTLADPWERLAPELLDRFAKAPAANVGDVFERLLVMDGGIRPFTSRTRLVGTALPILTRAGDNLAIHRALDDAQPGDILWRASQIPDTGPNKVRPGTEDDLCENGVGSSRLSSRSRP
jgi:hypothetical protein